MHRSSRPTDGEISAHIDAVGPLASVPLARDGIEVLDDAVLDAYLDGATALVGDGPRDLAIVYTAMHGVGAETVRRALRAGWLCPRRTR